jgi:hypothetical protein
MSWFRVADDWTEHPRFADADPSSVAFWLACVAYCARNETDGVIQKSALKRIRFCTQKRTKSLYDLGLLVDSGNGSVLIRDYLDHNPSKASIQAKRVAWRDRQRRARES